MSRLPFLLGIPCSILSQSTCALLLSNFLLIAGHSILIITSSPATRLISLGTTLRHISYTEPLCLQHLENSLLQTSYDMIS